MAFPVTALVGPLLGPPVSKLFEAILEVMKKTWRFRSELRKLKETITRIKPMINEIESKTKVLDRPKHEQEMFITLIEGAVALVQKSKGTDWNFYKTYRHAVELEALNESMESFFDTDVPLVSLTGIRDLQVKTDLIISMLERNLGRSLSTVPLLKHSVIGFKDQVRELKAMVLKDSGGDECSVVVVSAPGGYGKSTLVTKLCSDPQIKAKFGINIYYATISETPNIKMTIKKLLGGKEVDFANDDDAIDQWGSFLGERGSEILLVLDDVWAESVIKRFKFNLHGYKILVTSRSIFTGFETYELQLLNDHDATNMFRYYAFFEGGSERTDISDALVDSLVECCKNHPLVLSVVGGLLKGKHVAIWNDMLDNLSEGQQSVLDLDEAAIERRLVRSLNAFEEESVIKQCYMDFGLFPEDQKIPASLLMDIWVHLHNHDDEKGSATIKQIFDLSNKNLVTLLPISLHSPMIANYCEEKTIVQHDLMRTIAIRLSSQEPIADRKRLIINEKDLPHLPHRVNARILSISTGNDFKTPEVEVFMLNFMSKTYKLPQFMQKLYNRFFKFYHATTMTDEGFSLTWNNIKTPEVEVFVLNFMSKTYNLPQFMQTMKKLKVLIITNYGYYYSDLQNFPSPLNVSGLTTIRLEHVSISAISKSILELAHLRKLSLIMCKIGDSFNELASNKLPSLVEINIDSCDDLITFPSMFCNLISLKTLIITNCLELSSISEEFGNLLNLEVLRLASCSNLKILPESMRILQNLTVVDLSDCLHLEKLPEEIGNCSGLKTIHMRGCTSLEEIPESVEKLGALEVVCDEEIKVLWSDFTDVIVQLVEEDRSASFSKITQTR